MPQTGEWQAQDVPVCSVLVPTAPMELSVLHAPLQTVMVKAMADLLAFCSHYSVIRLFLVQLAPHCDDLAAMVSNYYPYIFVPIPRKQVLSFSPPLTLI
jgi:hypothetical protein